MDRLDRIDRIDRRRRISRLVGIAVGIALPALTTLVLMLITRVVSSISVTQLAMVYLAVVWAVAALTGVLPALVAAVLSFAALDYLFIPPVHHLYVAAREDWLTLGLFLLVASVQGLLTGRMRERQNEAAWRQTQTDAVMLLAQRLVTETSVKDMAAVVAEETAEVTHAVRAAVVVPSPRGLVTLGATDDFEAVADAGVERFASWCVENAVAVGLPRAATDEQPVGTWWPESVAHDEVVPGASRNDIFIPLNAAGSMQGVLYVGARSDRKPHALGDLRLVVSIAGLASVYLTRRALEEEASRARAILEADVLKSSLISSVSHELKTPLAAMTATVTGLLEGDATFEPVVVRRDLEAVREGLDRLDSSIGDLLDISRLESDAWRPSLEVCEVGDVLGTVLAKLGSADRQRVSVSVAEGTPQISADFGQWARMLGNLIENALEYSGSQGHVKVVAVGDESCAVITVEDDGPGIPADERDRVFEKFYRGRSARDHPSGTGLGLTIAVEIVRFHGGDIRVEAVMPHGARFVITMPAASSDHELE